MGPVGYNGTVGLPGAPGVGGAKGNRGPRGTTGFPGNKGVTSKLSANIWKLRLKSAQVPTYPSLSLHRVWLIRN